MAGELPQHTGSQDLPDGRTNMLDHELDLLCDSST